jgi:hypothetical protein
MRMDRTKEIKARGGHWSERPAASSCKREADKGSGAATALEDGTAWAESALNQVMKP